MKTNLNRTSNSIAAVGVILNLADGTIQSCNTSVEKNLGYSVDQLIGASFFEPPWQIIHEDASLFPTEYKIKYLNIFDRFRQAGSSSTRQYCRLGLGLAIVRHLTELQGEIVTVSSPGEAKRATFSFYCRISLDEYSIERKNSNG